LAHLQQSTAQGKMIGLPNGGGIVLCYNPAHTMQNVGRRKVFGKCIEVKWKKWLPFNSSAINGANIVRVVSA
jgi:hypothetical protein